jgi:competence protein ComEC
MWRTASRGLQTVATALALWLSLVWSVSSQTDTMRVHFIDVGQGASTLVEFPCAAIMVDTGGEVNKEFNSDEELVAYLDDFFAKRPDLKKTFHSLTLTHAHVDHTHGVSPVLSRYKVLNAITNGEEPPGPGLPGQKALHDKVSETEAGTNPIGFVAAEVKKIPAKRGLTNDIIDPVKCPRVDPKITVLWGGQNENPGWTKKAFDNQNNHSVVLRIDFGAASLLITGDLQEEAIHDLIEHYRGTAMLDTDVYLVGHHASHNGTTEELLQAITPKIAVIAMGVPTREIVWTAWAYGHPRKDIVELLESHVELPRNAVTVQVATAIHAFEAKRINRAIYATGWDGSVILEADTAGNWKKLDQTVASAPPAAAPAAAGPAAATSNLLDLNSATADQLTTLPRIGFVRAKAIVDYRTANGPFGSVDDLTNVKGIGPGTVLGLKDLVTVKRN